MDRKIYTGKPALMTGTSREEKLYNKAREQLQVEYLGDFFYDYNFPMDAKSSDIGKKYPQKGYRCQFGFWQVTNKGSYVKRNRPGERETPLLNGQKALVSYVVTPRVCIDERQGDLVNFCQYKEGHKYADVVDPGAIALSVNGTGLVKHVASALVDDATQDLKQTMKVSCEGEGQTVFTGFANANHCSVMTSVVLENSLPAIYSSFPGQIEKAPFDPTLNPGMFTNFDLSNAVFPTLPTDDLGFGQ